MFRLFQALFLLFYCRKEIFILTAMVVAIPVSLIYRGYCSYYEYRSTSYRNYARALMVKGPNLVSIQFDPSLPMADNYKEQVKNFNFPVLQSSKVYINLYGRPYNIGSTSEILDVSLRQYGDLPPPNVIEKTTGKNEMEDVVFRMYYVFRGDQALSEANAFLDKYALELIPSPTFGYTRPDYKTGRVDFSWKTQYKKYPGSMIKAVMWFDNKWCIETCCHDYDEGNDFYSLFRPTSREYQPPILNVNTPLSKVKL